MCMTSNHCCKECWIVDLECPRSRQSRCRPRNPEMELSFGVKALMACKTSPTKQIRTYDSIGKESTQLNNLRRMQKNMNSPKKAVFRYQMERYQIRPPDMVTSCAAASDILLTSHYILFVFKGTVPFKSSCDSSSRYITESLSLRQLLGNLKIN